MSPTADIRARLHNAIDSTLRELAIVEQMKKMIMIIDHMYQRRYQCSCTGALDLWGEYIRTAKVTLNQ